MTDPLGDVQSQTWTLPADLEAAVKGEIQAWQEADKVRRLWERDASLWTGTDEASWLGWLGLPEGSRSSIISSGPRKTRARGASTMSCSWGWAARASAPRCCG